MPQVAVDQPLERPEHAVARRPPPPYTRAMYPPRIGIDTASATIRISELCRRR